MSWMWIAIPSLLLNIYLLYKLGLAIHSINDCRKTMEEILRSADALRREYKKVIEER